MHSSISGFHGPDAQPRGRRFNPSAPLLLLPIYPSRNTMRRTGRLLVPSMPVKSSRPSCRMLIWPLRFRLAGVAVSSVALARPST
jgi:hypothetical protein